MATRYDPTANTQYPVSSQTASLRASQAATNAQLAAQNAAITASQRPSATASGNPTPSVTAAQLARIQNTYTAAQPSVTSSLSSRPFRDPTTAQVAAQGASNGVRPSLTESPRAAQQQAQASANAQQYVKNLAGSYNANDARQQVQARNAAAANPRPSDQMRISSNIGSLPSASNTVNLDKAVPLYSGQRPGESFSDGTRAIPSSAQAALSTATPAAATPAATTPAAAETPKATMYTPTTLTAKATSTTTPAATPSSTVATPAATTAPAATNSPAATTTKSGSGSESVTTSAPVEYTPTGIYAPGAVDAYNDQRVADIRALYDAALQNSLASMQKAYDQNMSDAEAARDLISPQYQRSMNSLSAEYERQRRNNNMQAAANGLNTGAGSQMALAQSANYQANQAGLAAKENEALNEANRRIGDLQRNYQNAIAEATANNNYKLAASLMEEYQNAYNRQLQIENTNYERSRQMEQQNYTRSWNEDERSYSRGVDEAGRKAQYGDFSGYKDIYGEEIANLMELTWAMQNPDVAWASGKLSAEDYMALTGRQPVNPTDAGAIGDVAGGLGSGRFVEGMSGGSGSIDSRAYSSGGYSSGGGGYSSRGRSGGASGYGKGYNGPPGYYNEAGQFIVPDGNGGVAASYGSAQGADRYNTNPNVNGNVSAQGAKDYAEAYAKAYGSGGGSSGGSYTGGGSSGGGTSLESATAAATGGGDSGGEEKSWKNLWGLLG